MMFSMALKFLPTDKLAQRMPLLQHLVAMAVVHGIKTIPGYEVSSTIHVLRYASPYQLFTYYIVR